MKLLEYYVSLRVYQKENEYMDSMRVTVQDLANVLCCTERNVKILLKRMAEENWLTWEPGRGRGNISTLTFHKDMRTGLTEIFNQMLQNDDLTGAINLLKENLPEDI